MQPTRSVSEEMSELLQRGVEEVIDRSSLVAKLERGTPLRVKLGIDPTSPNIHLGRSIPLLKLRDFQQLGHQVVLIIGDFTGVIGDTSDKDSERPMLTPEAVQANLRTYIQQAAKIIDMDKAEIHYNSAWLGELTYSDIGRQADGFSLNQFISRDNISRRLEAGKRVSLRELLYPLMQGYDSVAVRADVEIGGTDQRFNLLAGRDLQRLYDQPPQDVITNPLIEGLDGRKMSSSYGNTVNLLDEPNEMFGKIMTLNDEFIAKYFTLLTRLPLSDIAAMTAELEAGANPRDLKLRLATEIVRLYHSADAATAAEQYFVRTFSHKEVPTDLQEVSPQQYDIVSVLTESRLVASNAEARRVIEQGGVRVDGAVVADISYVVPAGSVLQKGKTAFRKIL